MRRDKTTGKATYALDIRRPGMVTAVVARPPRFGGAVKSFDGSAAKLVLQALATSKASPEELVEIKKLLRGGGAPVTSDDPKTGGSR